MPDLPAVGEDFAGYRMLGVLGRGRTSVVYEAANPRLGNVIALKVLDPDLADDDVFRSRFFEESRIAATLNHPNVIPIHDMGTSHGLLYIAMRRVAGTDMRQLLAATARLEPGHAIGLLAQAARALDAAHRHGLVHRDVKPGNLLVEPGGDDPDHLYLTDFGITKVTTSRTGLTSPGEFVGTIDYIAPEQIRGISVMGMADQYSLACVLYECLTGHVPFRKKLDAAVIFAHVEEQPPPPSSLCADLSPAIDGVLARALAKQPGDRFGSCREFIEAADAALAEKPSRLGAVAGLAPVPPPNPVLEHAHGSTYGGTPPDVEEMRRELEAARGVRPNEDEDPAGPAAPPPGRTTGSRRWPVVAAVLVLAAAAGGIPWLLSQDASGVSGTPGTAATIRPAAMGSSMAMAPQSGAAPQPGTAQSGAAQSGAAQSGTGGQSPLMTAIVQTNTITRKVPPSTCTQQGTTQVTCMSPAPGITEALFRTYPSLTALYAAYETAMKSLDGGTVEQNTQNCGDPAPPPGGAEMGWNHQFQHPHNYTIAAMAAGQVPVTGAAGRVFCITSRTTGVAQFLWTQSDGHVLAWVAGPLHEQVWDWWATVHHEIAIGKPPMMMLPSMGAVPKG